MTADAQGPRFVLTGGESSRTYVLEVSTNLTSWSVLQTISTDLNGECVFRPARAASDTKSFYRVRVP